jgi:transposase
MKSHSTIFWFLLAMALAASIWALNTFFRPSAAGEPPVFAGLRAGQVTEIQIVPGGAREISVIRTNQAWLLQKPLVYPAQAATIDGLLARLEKVTPALSFSAAEMSRHKDADAEFGFDHPQFTLDITAGDRAWHVLVGKQTAPGDGVYLRIVGATGAVVTDPAWLQFLPLDANGWRDTTLVDVPDTLDWLIITNGTQALELRRDLTNRLWRIIRPLQARANNLRILMAVQQLRSAHVSHFINDDPKADLSSYGLDPAALDVWLGAGTNLLTAFHTGKEAAGAPGETYARREGWHAVLTTLKEPLAPWRGTVNDFRDTNFFELTAPVAEIEVQGENKFTLQQTGSNVWTVAGEKFPVDADEVNGFIRSLASLGIAHFVQDVVTASGLQNFGLSTPTRQITLSSAVNDTNSVIARLQFGGSTTNEIYAKCAGEEFVYALSLDAFNRLPMKSDYFRDPRVWSFSENDVAQVTLRQGGRMLQLVRGGTNDWSLAAGSQGIINPPAVEETVHRLGQLTVAGWLGRNYTPAQLGLNTNNLSISVQLKSGRECAVDFGADIHSQTALATVTLDGQPWAFVFPPTIYPLIRDYLSIPPPAPATAP